MIQLIQPETVVCWPWRLRGCDKDIGDRHPIGAECRVCGQDVALPADKPAAKPICLYCGMDAGHVEIVEIEPDWDQ